MRGITSTVCPAASSGLADDERFDEAHAGKLRGDNAVAAVFDVVAAAHAVTQNAAHHLTSVFEVDAHLLDHRQPG